MPLVPLTTVSLGQAQDAWWFRQLEESAKAPRIVPLLCVGGEEPVCFATWNGEELGPLGETEDTVTVYQIEIVTKAIVSGTLGRKKRSVQCSSQAHLPGR